MKMKRPTKIQYYNEPLIINVWDTVHKTTVSDIGYEIRRKPRYPIQTRAEIVIENEQRNIVFPVLIDSNRKK